MNLKAYIREHGIDVCAKRFGVSVHTIRSWLRSGHWARYPDRITAQRILSKAPELSWEGIYPPDA